jgi:hypothetical protein
MNIFFDALFFKLYALAKRTGKKDVYLAMNTAFSFMVMIFSILTIATIEYFECFLLQSTLLLGSIRAMLVVVIIIFVIFYSRYMYRHQYKIFYARYRTENFYHNKRGTWIMVGFIIATFLFFSSLIWIKCL